MVSPLFTVIIFAEFYICADLYGVQKRSKVLKLTIPHLSPFREWMLSFLKASLMCSTVWMESLEGWLGLKIIYFH